MGGNVVYADCGKMGVRANKVLFEYDEARLKEKDSPRSWIVVQIGL